MMGQPFMACHDEVAAGGVSSEGAFMAIGAYFHPGSLTTAQYDQVIAALDEAGEGRPAGRISHCSFGPADNLMVFEIWETEQACNEFGKVLMPILEKAGIETGPPDVLPIHHMIF